MTKTEQKLLDRLAAKGGRCGYNGSREADAARKLEAKGLVTMRVTDGRWSHYTMRGGYKTGYHPQGTIERRDGVTEHLAAFDRLVIAR